ncbi:MAG: HNH endonuclease, partial [Oxalobacteraceae bacterium]
MRGRSAPSWSIDSARPSTYLDYIADRNKLVCCACPPDDARGTRGSHLGPRRGCYFWRCPVMARPRTTPLPSIASLRAQFAYNPFTGELVHKPRKGEGHYVTRFNRQYAGRVAGTVMNQGYLFVAPHNSNQMLGHRVAWAIHYGEWPEIEVDHRDGNKLNNAIDNLRPATRTQNMRNLP